MPRIHLLVGLLAVFALASSAAVEAQRPAADSLPTGTLVGSVLDAESGAPIADATVVLAPEAATATAVRNDGRLWSSGFATTTDDQGRYRFEGVPFGRHILRVRRLGYRPGEVAVHIARPEPFGVSIGLEVVPILLEPEDVRAPGAVFGGELGPTPVPTARLAAEAYRQRRFLAGDARVLTRGEMIEAVTLGESDLLRALHRLPGVTTRDDFTAELWTRGAPWSHTRVYFDELPLFNPVHTSGVFGAINPDAVGSAVFQPGVRSARLGEGAAAVLDLTSRPALSTELSGAAELSVVSARATADRRFGDGRGGAMVALRRSYVDLVTGLASAISGDSTTRIPYAFYDGAAHVSLPLDRARQLEVSGFWEVDRVGGDIRDLLRNSRGSWGNAAARATLLTPVGPLLGRFTVGGTRFHGELLPEQGMLANDSAPAHAPMDNRVAYSVVAGEIESSRTPPGTSWSAGFQLLKQELFYEGPAPRPYPSSVVFDSLSLETAWSGLALWGEVRDRLATNLDVGVGLRLEMGDEVENAGAAVLSPRLSARWTVGGGRAAVTAGYGRSYQYTQAVAPAGPEIGPNLHLTEVWLLAGHSTPAIRADVGTFGIEGWLGDTWLGSVNLYARRATGVTVPDPTPGRYSDVRPVFVGAANDARGIELSARKLVGTWTGSIAYTFGLSNLRVGALRYPSPADRRGVLDATMLTSVTEGVRAGAALTIASGAPFTRFFTGVAGVGIPCDSIIGSCPNPGDSLLVIQQANAERAPSYATVDLLAEWHKSYGSWQLGVWVQLRNALNRRNDVTYVGSVAGSTAACEGIAGGTTAVPAGGGVCDLFDAGVRLLPLAGVSIAF
jgi:hypothetical protein